jgi:hypothetical protein
MLAPTVRNRRESRPSPSVPLLWVTKELTTTADVLTLSLLVRSVHSSVWSVKANSQKLTCSYGKAERHVGNGTFVVGLSSSSELSPGRIYSFLSLGGSPARRHPSRGIDHVLNRKRPRK